MTGRNVPLTTLACLTVADLWATAAGAITSPSTVRTPSDQHQRVPLSTVCLLIRKIE